MLLDHLVSLPQLLLPTHAISRIGYALTRVRVRWFKNACIRAFSHLFQVNMAEAQYRDPDQFPDFNSFFTRALRPEARPLDPDPLSLICPVDGTLREYGAIDDDRLLQAKGQHYTLDALLGDVALAETFRGGQFATVYLAPKDYHRVHMPSGGKLHTMIHVPGRHFSVSAATARTIPGLFARNERLVAAFDTPHGPLALVLVGALNVAGLEAVWSGPLRPPGIRHPRHWHYPSSDVVLARGAEMGRFNMGSTVIILLGPHQVQWDQGLIMNRWLPLGTRLGGLSSHPLNGPTSSPHYG